MNMNLQRDRGAAPADGMDAPPALLQKSTPQREKGRGTGKAAARERITVSAQKKDFVLIDSEISEVRRA